MTEKNLIVLLGPTGVGKTDLSINIAKYLDSEIISGDSRQLFRGMQIGTAAPSDDQMKRVKHHFINIVDPPDYYSASMYEKDVLELLPTLFKRMNSVLLVGGSGMYIDAVCNGIDEIPDVDPGIRKKYLDKYHNEGIESLRADLRILDPEHYKKVDLRNHKRILRALEICETTGRPYSSFMRSRRISRSFRIFKIGLKRNRDELYGIINNRVDRMIEKGLIDEARSLIKYRNCNALNTVGYRELFDYFDCKINLEEAVRLIKRNSRRYAKRQMTWWAKDKEITWFSPDENESIMGWIDKRIKPA